MVLVLCVVPQLFSMVLLFCGALLLLLWVLSHVPKDSAHVLYDSPDVQVLFYCVQPFYDVLLLFFKVLLLFL